MGGKAERVANVGIVARLGKGTDAVLVVAIRGREVQGPACSRAAVTAIQVWGRRGEVFCFHAVGAGAIWVRRGPEFVPIPFVVASPVVNSVGVFGTAPLDILLFRVSLGLGFSFRGRRRLVKATPKEFLGSEQAVMGFEVVEIAQHHVDQETDGRAAVVSLLPDQVYEFLVKRRSSSGLRGGRGGSSPRHAGCGRAVGDEGANRIEAEVEELAGSIEPMTGPGSLQTALHDINEEANDKAAVVGLLANDVCKGLLRSRRRA